MCESSGKVSLGCEYVVIPVDEGRRNEEVAKTTDFHRQVLHCKYRMLLVFIFDEVQIHISVAVLSAIQELVSEVAVGLHHHTDALNHNDHAVTETRSVVLHE